MELMPGYKHSDVGVIPEDWDVLPLGECLVSRPSYGINAAAVPYSDALPVYIRITDISEDGRFSPDKFVSVKSEQACNYYLSDGDIVFARTGASVGKSYRYDPKDGALVFAGFLIRVRPDANKLLPVFAAAYVTTGNYWRWVRLMSMRSGQPGINGNEYSQLPIPLPLLPEQRAIAQTLSDVDALLATLDQVIAKKRDLRQAAMQQLLTGKTRLPGCAGEWEAKPFSAVLSRLNAKSHQIQASEYQETGRFPVVDQGKYFVVGFSDREDKRFRCPDSGVIVFGDHTCIVKFIDFDFLVGADGTQILHGKHGQNTRFHALQLQYRGIETTGYNRHFKILKEREFFVPPLPEQAAIATILSEMDAELSVLESRRNKTRDIKQAMMQELLTGKTRLIAKEESHV
jgi:type I restriction enzyme S subunit